MDIILLYIWNTFLSLFSALKQRLYQKSKSTVSLNLSSVGDNARQVVSDDGHQLCLFSDELPVCALVHFLSQIIGEIEVLLIMHFLCESIKWQCRPQTAGCWIIAVLKTQAFQGNALEWTVDTQRVLLLCVDGFHLKPRSRNEMRRSRWLSDSHSSFSHKCLPESEWWLNGKVLLWNVLHVENFAVRIWFKFKKDIRVIVKSSALDDACGRSAVEKSPDLNIWIEFPIPGILFVPGHEPQNKNAVS